MTAMGLNWFTRHKNDKKTTDEAVGRVIDARLAVTAAADRLTRALDLTDGSRMELTLDRLIDARQVKR